MTDSSHSPPYLTREEIERVADRGELAAFMRSAYSHSSGAVVPPRALILRENPFSAFVSMAALSEQHALFIAKIGTVVPKHITKGPSVHALVVAFSTESGAPIAFIDGVSLTNLKCAAVSAMVTDLCAREDATTLAIIGSGVQALEQLRGVSAVRSISRVRVFSRDPKNVEEFVRRSRRFAGKVEFIACSSAESAVEDADIVSTATTSTESVIASESLGRAGLHINCMGAHTPNSRELPASVLRESTVFVEDLDTAIAEAGDTHRNAVPLEELMQLNVGILRGQRTVFCSTGHAFLDLLVSAYLLKNANLNAS